MLFAVQCGKNGLYELVTEKRRISGDLLLVLTYALAFELFAPDTVLVPVGTPGVVEHLARKFGVHLKVDGNIHYDKKLYRMFNDFPYMCILLAEKLLRSGETLEEYLSALPNFYSNQREITCDWRDIGRILRRLCADAPDGILTKGVQVMSEKGRSWVCPDDHFPAIRIKTEGATEEFARELCDFYSERIKEMLRKNP